MEAPAASHGVEQHTEACNMFLIPIKVIIARDFQILIPATWNWFCRLGHMNGVSSQVEILRSELSSTADFMIPNQSVE
jgi:hypothetical protein